MFIGPLLIGGAALILWAMAREGRFNGAPTWATHRPASPLEQAEYILAQRYARRAITAEEYERMLAILRR